MTGQVDPGAPGRSIRLWALHSLLLFAAMVAPFLYFLPSGASLWSAATGAVYLLWWMVAGVLRDRGVDPDAESPARARFLEEAQVTAQLDHPSVVPVHLLGNIDDGQSYFSTTLAEHNQAVSQYQKSQAPGIGGNP